MKTSQEFKVAFLQNIWEDCLGMQYLSSAIKSHGFGSRIFIEGHGWWDKIKAYRPNLVAFSCTTGLQHWVHRSARKAKLILGEETAVIVGGPHPTFYPDMVSHKSIDIICRGEGERAFVELLRRMREGSDITGTPNMWVKKDGCIYRNELLNRIENIDEILFPDRSYYDAYPFLRKNPYKAVICSRGCPYKCSFCFNEFYNIMYRTKGKAVRYRSVDNIIEEIALIRDDWGLKSVHFVDDIFCTDRKWLFEFAERYARKLRIPYTCNIRANLTDEDVMKALASSGCRQVLFGIESGEPRLRNSILGKAVTDEDIRTAASLAHKYKMKFTTFNMIGIPTETVDDAFKTFHLNRSIRADYSWFAICQPYPGTDLFNSAVERGLMPRITNINEFRPTSMKGSPIKQDNINELVNLHKFFLIAIKLPFLETVLRRLIKLRANPVFDLIFMASYGYVTARRRALSLFEIISLGLRSRKLFVTER